MHYFQLYLILLFVGASHSNLDAQNPLLEEVNIKIGDLNKTKQISEIFDHIEYITLDSSVLIDQIVDLEITDERIILLERTFGLERNLYIYNRQGKLLQRLEGNALGLGDFVGAYDFLIDHDNSTIKVLDVRKRKIIDFNMDGQLIQETPTVDSIIFHFFVKHPTSKQYVFHSGNETTSNERYNIFYVNENLIDIESRSQYIPNHISGMGFTYSPFVQSNEKDIYYKEWYNDTVFYVGKNALVPKYHLNFEHNTWITKEELNKVNRKNISYIVNKIDKNPNLISEIRNFVDRKNHLLMTFNYNKKRYWSTYNKHTKDSEFFLPGNNDIDSGISPRFWHFSTNESIVFTLYPSQIAEFYQELYDSTSPEELKQLMRTDFKNFASVVSQISSNSNPVLMIAHFKEEF